MKPAQQAPSLSGHANNFDVLRFLFASLVVFSHSYPLGEGHELHEPLRKLTGQTTLGGLSVHCFFIISGFLIAASWDRRKDVGQFLKKRVLRIYPGFIIANMVGVFLVAPMATDSAIGNAGVSLRQFAWDCMRLQGTQLPDTLFPQNHLHARSRAPEKYTACIRICVHTCITDCTERAYIPAHIHTHILIHMYIHTYT